MSKLVSIIIPCYNAEKWIREAIDSCLNQTYPNIEIIVIDDGSTDRSLEFIKNYGNKIIWKTGENRGGNHARNRGFSLSRGEYIQFLDADDYILPEKITRQVNFLEENNADVVYGDWRHQKHFTDGKFILEDIQVSGQQSNILASLLADWWVSPACILFNREAVEKSGGWDETLKAGQDRDFFLSVVINNAKVSYQPGCYSIYRRYGNVTVSSSSQINYLKSHEKIVQKAEKKLSQQKKLTAEYRCALAQSYFVMARKYLEIDSDKYYQLLNKALALCPKFQPDHKHRTAAYNLVQNIFGFKIIETIIISIKLLKIKLKKQI
jgi:glycosyltransferase involved in cell wall biosynthesis